MVHLREPDWNTISLRYWINTDLRTLPLFVPVVALFTAYTYYSDLCVSYFRKKLFKQVHNFVHLNLAIALFVGYLTFTFGVELAASNEVYYERPSF